VRAMRDIFGDYVTEFSCVEKVGTPPSYDIYVELAANNAEEQVKNHIDERLQQLSPVYASFRRKSAIGKPSVFFCS